MKESQKIWKLGKKTKTKKKSDKQLGKKRRGVRKRKVQGEQASRCKIERKKSMTSRAVREKTSRTSKGFFFFFFFYDATQRFE